MIEYGVYTALVTPFLNGEVSYECLKNLLDAQVVSGVKGVVICGTTGESPTLSSEEYQSIIRYTTEYVGDKILVFVGVGSNNTKEAVRKTVLANKFNISGVLAVTPYYNKPTQSGLLDYFEQIATATNKSVILYSVPSRCGVEISVETIRVLSSKFENICSLKEATDNCARIDAIREVVGEDFTILSGNDSMTIPFMSLGAKGVISVASNIYPEKMVQIVEHGYNGKFKDALKIYCELYPVINKLFIETNPLPIKFLLQQKGIIASYEARSPLGMLSQNSINELKNVLC